MSGDILVGVPVYRGAETVAETLRSILDQTYSDFQVLISVDDPEDRAVEVCRSFAHSDSRIELIVQPRRLGWPSNLNWLLDRCDRPFFCYWQQDDLASTRYLELLRQQLSSRRDAAIAYTDVQWFGAGIKRTSCPSTEGDALSRTMQQIEAIRYEPLRGLIRTSMLPQGPDFIPVTNDESCEEEFVFLTGVASRGAFLRVEGALYFKRLHRANSFSRWTGWPDWRRRRGWISMGLGMYRVAEPLTPVGMRSELLGHVIDRLAVSRPGRGFFYQPAQTPAELARFTREFFARGDLDPGPAPPPGGHPFARPVHPVVHQQLEEERAFAQWRAAARKRIAAEGTLRIEPASDGFAAVLGYGWSRIEPWGVWSDGDEASLRLPIPAGAGAEVLLFGRVFGVQRPFRVEWSVRGRDAMQVQELSARSEIELRLQIEPALDAGCSLELGFPDAVSPLETGLSSDPRRLGIGLARIELRWGLTGSLPRLPASVSNVSGP